jgi:hypothetical protein
MNLDLNILHILILSLVLLVSYYPVNRALKKSFNKFVAVYFVTFTFRLLLIPVAFKFCNTIDIALSLIVMIVGEVICAKMVGDRNNKVVEAVA